MNNLRKKSESVCTRFLNGESIEEIRSTFDDDSHGWTKISERAYRLFIEQSRSKRDQDAIKPNVSCATNNQVSEIFETNLELADYALCLPPDVTHADCDRFKLMLSESPRNDKKIFLAIEEIAMNHRMRALQQKGRFEKLDIFKEFSVIIEAGVLSYYRGNYISSFLTLIPLVEGIILRWMGFNGNGVKPDFKKIKQFFSISHQRHPCPGNPLFHQVYAMVSDKIIKEHLFKPSQQGNSHSNFNRHLASHLLNDSEFATRENVVRLCLLLDNMSVIYMYENYIQDARFWLKGEEFELEYKSYIEVSNESERAKTPEKRLLHEKTC